MVISPLTKSRDVTLVSTIRSSKLIDDWEKTFKINIKDELLGIDEIHLYQCNQTKLLFFEPPNVAGSSWLYEKLQEHDWFYIPYKWEHQIALEDIKHCHRVLEVGCAFGSFVEAGLKANIDIQGIELNKAAVAVAQNNKLPIRHLSLKKFANCYPGSLDALCSFQVLEHIKNPRDFLGWAIQSLKVGGKLIICVPNSDSFIKHQYNLLDMPPHHMLRWSETSFRALEDLFSIRLEKVLREPLASYHVSGFLNCYKALYRAQCPLSVLLLNRYTLVFYEKLLQLGFKKYLTGQSLYVQFQKIA
jgi:SAM-dependent methyltransferase